MAGGAEVQARHGDHAARSARVPGPLGGRQRRGGRRRHVQPRGQRQQLGGRALRAQQPVRERVPGQRRLQARGHHLQQSVATASATTAHQAVHGRQRRDGLCDTQEETSSAATPEVREDATHHRRVVTAAFSSHTLLLPSYIIILYLFPFFFILFFLYLLVFHSLGFFTYFPLSDKPPTGCLERRRH